MTALELQSLGVSFGGFKAVDGVSLRVADGELRVLLDEPNEGIQPSVVQEIEAAISRMNRELGLTMVLVEQNIDFVRRVASSFAMFEKGSIVASGPIEMLSDEIVDRHMTF